LSVPGQLFVCVKMPSAGEIENPVRFTAAEPSLVIVALMVSVDPTATVPKFSDPGVNPKAKPSPVPVSAMVCAGLPGELSFSVNPPFTVPCVVGVKLTVMVQFSPVLSVVGQVFVSPKTLLLTMLVSFTVRLLTLVTVTVCGGLVSPICRRPKFKLDDENVSVSGV